MPFQIGKLSEFVEGKENFVNYVERLDQYFEANDIEDEKKMAVFLSVIGPGAYGILRNLVQPGLPKDKTYNELVKALTDHYMPKPLIISERFKFHKRNQKEGETVAAYVVELKKLTIYCEFGAFLNEALRDRLVCGLKSENIQKKLLSEADLDFEKAIKISTAMETAEKDTLSFTGTESVNFTKARTSGTSHTQGKHRTHMNSKKGFHAPSGKGSQCYRCGDAHFADKCKFKSTKCYKCGKIGHLARKCLGQGSGKAKITKYVSQDDEFDEEETIYTVYNTDSGNTVKTYKVNLGLGPTSVEFQVDTGSACTIINEKIYRDKLSQSCTLQKTKTKLKSYTGDSIEVLGKCTVPVTYMYENETKQLIVYVVKGNRPCLLGRDWLSRINLNWKNIFSVTSDNLESLFEGNSGAIRDYKAQIKVEDDVQPVFCKARPVPYALKENVEQQLRKLEENGVIYPVKTSKWAAPIVVVPKSDKSIRICGDYKVTVNRVISKEQYPLPNIDDMFATLAGGRKFTKLDLTQAYTQLELEEGVRSILL